MGHILTIHPEYECPPVSRIEVEAVRTGAASLTLRYILSGEIGDVLLPAPEHAVRAHQLWEHSCFEVFIRAGAGGGYCEFNFAPSREWAAYRFRTHRSGMEDIEVSPPRMEPGSDEGAYEMRVALDLSNIPELTADETWQLNLSTVVEETNGRKSYWALAHPPGKADFHDPNCFVLDLPPAA